MLDADWTSPKKFKQASPHADHSHSLDPMDWAAEDAASSVLYAAVFLNQ